MIISARRAPASRNAPKISTRSEAPAPTALIASTISDNSTPVSKTKALAVSSSTSISVSATWVASPAATVAPAAVVVTVGSPERLFYLL